MLACLPLHGYNARSHFIAGLPVRHLLLLILFTVSLAGYGQKGGVYIPQDEPAPAAPTQEPSGTGK